MKLYAEGPQQYDRRAGARRTLTPYRHTDGALGLITTGAGVGTVRVELDPVDARVLIAWLVEHFGKELATEYAPLHQMIAA